MKFYVVGSWINTVDTRGVGGNFGWMAPIKHRTHFSEKEILNAFPKDETIMLFEDKAKAQRFSVVTSSAGSCPVFEVEVHKFTRNSATTFISGRENIKINSAVFTSDKQIFEFDYSGRRLSGKSDSALKEEKRYLSHGF